MKTRRLLALKAQVRSAGAVYHCVSHTVNSEPYIDDAAKASLRTLIWQMADFCGVQILTYAIMSDHFHILVRVPGKKVVEDAELLRRYQALRPKPSPYEAKLIKSISTQIKEDKPDAETAAWRKRQLLLTGNVSQFMKLLKQRFCMWFNRTRHRSGTMWSDRFGSALVEESAHVMTTIAAYIDLNAVRAKITHDPKEYPYCGYGEAAAGGKAAQAGIVALMADENADSWREAHEAYRRYLFGSEGKAPAGGRKPGVSKEALETAIKKKAALPREAVLRHRVRHFTDGGVIGSEAFVATHLAAYKKSTGSRKKSAVRPLPGITDWGDIVTMRGVHKKALGGSDVKT